MIIGGLQRVSLIDYPGEISAVLFTVGCNFRCPYCHNPELVTRKAQKLDIDSLFDFLKKRVGKLSAVSITGGEPTLHYDLVEFIERIRLLGYKKIKLDTNGTNPYMLKKLIDKELITYIAMDIKAPFEKYETVTDSKCDLENIKKSMDIIQSGKVDYEFRTTVVKGLIEKDDIINIAGIIKGAKSYYIQRFIPSKTLNGKFMEKQTLSHEELEYIKRKISSMFGKFAIR